ncbi:CHAD domain-containing protein [Oscillatoriales cyanobacterium LEGE 11467]|uniref:CHAD domain-containing protein n=1 Tax=Zarconia navalis LEGE 11467 TaxID=1828826 RepID=A0A928VYZ3_9CYAN|nr:CHAD domain-containing protein [Zarconia navalis]MBE9040753.1 CHAD domain-containing protein [Zarconia navalis LEGE 11467]
MKTQISTSILTLGDYANREIRRSLKKCIKHKKQVLKDSDTEPLHQMRIGFRRLRTAISVFDRVLQLPEEASARRIRKTVNVLGAVRDLDVLQQELVTRYRPNLSGKEGKRLDSVLDRLKKQRVQDFRQLEKALKGDRFDRLVRSLQNWLDRPAHKAMAVLPVRDALPDLLLPLLAQLFLHPGWWVGTTQGSELNGGSVANVIGMLQQIDRESASLHDLRKQVKRVRYQTEVFVDCYDEAYTTQTREFKHIQGLLGQMQDQAVLREFLEKQLECDIARALPTVAEQMRLEQWQLWQEWQPIRYRYLDAEFRQSVRLLVLNPA